MRLTPSGHCDHAQARPNRAPARIHRPRVARDRRTAAGLYRKTPAGAARGFYGFAGAAAGIARLWGCAGRTAAPTGSSTVSIPVVAPGAITPPLTSNRIA